MKAIALLIHVLMLNACSPLIAMSKRGPTSWPPLLWATHQPVKQFAQTLKLNGITAGEYVKSQLTHARSELLASFATTTLLSEHDIKSIAAVIQTIKAYDETQSELHPRLRLGQQVIREKIPQIEMVARDLKYPSRFEVLYDSHTYPEAYAIRSMHEMVFDIDNTLVLSRPIKGSYGMPQLYIGKGFWECNEMEKLGLLIREIGGHMMLEHRCEIALFEQVMKKRTIAPELMREVLYNLALFQMIEADLTPALNDKVLVQAIKAFVKRSCALFDVEHGNERVRNLEWVEELNQEMDPVFKSKVENATKKKH